MRIEISQLKDSMEADAKIEIAFFKEKGNIDKNFDLKIWRLLQKENADIILWVIMKIALGNYISAYSYTDKELKSMKDQEYKSKKDIKKIITIFGMIFGLFLVISPIFNWPNYPEFYFVSLGYILVIISAIAHASID